MKGIPKMKMEVESATRIAGTGLHAVGTCLLDPSITPVYNCRQNRTKPTKVPIYRGERERERERERITIGNATAACVCECVCE